MNMCKNELCLFSTQITESDSPEFQGRKERAARLEREIESVSGCGFLYVVYITASSLLPATLWISFGEEL